MTAAPEPEKKKVRKLSRIEWIRAEEMYRAGDTQVEIARKFRISKEAVSRHMTAAGVKGGDKAEQVRKEIEEQVARKKRDWAEAREKRKVLAKEHVHGMSSAVVSLFMKDLKKVSGDPKSTAAEIMPASKAMKEAIAAIGLHYDLMSRVLDIQPGEDSSDNLPELVVTSMTEEEENALRDAKSLGSEDDEDPEEAEAESDEERDEVVEGDEPPPPAAADPAVEPPAE